MLEKRYTPAYHSFANASGVKGGIHCFPDDRPNTESLDFRNRGVVILHRKHNVADYVCRYFATDFAALVLGFHKQGF